MMSRSTDRLFILLATALLFAACQQPGGNSTGSEYMADMAHSTAYEANVYTDYSFNTWDNASVKKRKELSMPGMPVVGTIPRGYAGNQDKKYMDGSASTNAVAIPANGSVPYYYADNDNERARAVANIISNPFPITEAGLAVGKELYDIQCGICHGEKGDGNGWLVDEKNTNAKYGAAPADFTQDTFYNSTNGRFYHSIMYGKNVMGGYADKLSYEERWQVIHYIHSLMAQHKGLEYSEKANTLTSIAADRPLAVKPQVAEKTTTEEPQDGDADKPHEATEEGGGHEEGGDH